MAEIIEKIGKLLLEQAIPAARKLSMDAAKMAVELRNKAIEMAKEEPRQPIAEDQISKTCAEHHMVGPVPTAQPEESVSEVIQRLFSQAGSFESVELLFVIDAGQKLLGIVLLSRLVSAPPHASIGELMTSKVDSVLLGDHPEQVAEVALRHEIPAVPVVDENGCLLGAVHAHTVFRILREDHIQDVDRLVGIWRNSEQALSAIEGNPVRRTLNRLPWLMVGTVGCIFATGLMATFENTLRADLAVAFFIPGIVYLADAIGTQSEAIAVRGLSFSNVPIPQLLRGEFKTGLFLGIALAVAVFPFIWVAFNAKLAFAVSLALIFASSAATSIGLMLPSVLSRFGRDPAYGSGPVATIIQDLLSLLIYLWVVSLLVI